MRQGLNLCSININGHLAKLEKSDCISFLNNFDIVCLNEIKSSYPVTIPGFRSIRSNVIANEALRGGVAVLFKQNIWDLVYNITLSKDQVWFSLYCVPDFRFGAVYIPPRDSLYFSVELLSHIQEQLTEPFTKVVIIGDMNARMPNVETTASKKCGVSHTANPDTVSNANGKDIHALCESLDLVIINHMVYNARIMDGGFTYKKGRREVSQLDWALCTPATVKHLEQFNIDRTTTGVKNMSDHYMIWLNLCDIQPSSKLIHERACQLGISHIAHSEIHRNAKQKKISMNSVNYTNFLEALPDTQGLWSETLSPSGNCETISSAIYMAASSASKPQKPIPYTAPGNSQERWRNLLSENDEKKIWRSINWRGEWDYTGPDTSPSDETFTDYFDTLFNPEHTSGHEPLFTPDQEIYIPVLDDPIQPLEVEDALRKLKPNKAAGTDGLPPGVLKYLPAQWIMLLCTLFNCVFSGEYIPAWLTARFVTIHKKGDKTNPANYRGITVLASCAPWPKCLTMYFSAGFFYGTHHKWSKLVQLNGEDVLIKYFVFDY